MNQADIISVALAAIGGSAAGALLIAKLLAEKLIDSRINHSLQRSQHDKNRELVLLESFRRTIENSNARLNEKEIEVLSAIWNQSREPIYRCLLALDNEMADYKLSSFDDDRLRRSVHIWQLEDGYLEKLLAVQPEMRGHRMKLLLREQWTKAMFREHKELMLIFGRNSPFVPPKIVVAFNAFEKELSSALDRISDMVVQEIGHQDPAEIKEQMAVKLRASHYTLANEIRDHLYDS